MAGQEEAKLMAVPVYKPILLVLVLPCHSKFRTKP